MMRQPLLPLLWISVFLFPFVVFTGLGTWTCAGNAVSLWMADWQRVDARITASDLFYSGRDLEPKLKATLEEPRACEIRYTFAYEVDGQTYVGAGGWNEETSWQAAEELFHNSYQPETPIEVQFDANHPQESRHGDTTVESALVMTVATLVIGTMFVILTGVFLFVVSLLFGSLRGTPAGETAAGDQRSEQIGLSGFGKWFRNLIVSLVVAGLFIGLPFVGIAQWSGFQDENALSDSWPTVEGTIIESEILRRTRTSRRSTTVYYAPSVAYRYSVDGREYESQKVAATDIEAAYEYAAELVARYPPGGSATVYVNPEDPADALLVSADPLLRNQSLFQMFGLGFMALLGIGVLLMVWMRSS